MECFYHQGSQACGICKSCQRGICKQCASEVSNGIACKEKCEDQAIELDNLVSNSIKMQKSSELLVNTASAGMGAGELFTLVLGAIFTAYGVYESTMFLTVLGVAFLLFGAFGIFKIFKAKKESNTDIT